MNLKQAKNLLRENGYKLYKKEIIDESFDSVYEFIEMLHNQIKEHK